MSEQYFRLLQSLRDFQFDLYDFKNTQQALDHELLMTNRLIKKEVLDTADLVEQISRTMLFMNSRIDQSQQEQTDQIV